MTDNPLLHPEKNELVAFGLGKLESDEATRIETHLGECKACCETLLDLKDDTFVELVRNSPEPKQGTKCAKDSVSSELTEPVDSVATDESISAATMLVESGIPRVPADLPAQLKDHPRYRIIELIGKGGMGDVYKARHRLMDRLVALKLINQDLVKNTQAVERFRREVRAAASLTHPNIVTSYDAEKAGDVHFLVMEFVDGTDLSSVVQKQGPLPIARACDCIRQAANGLQHAHEMGMVHRDIKPHNLMLSESGQVSVLDFGLAGFAAESVLLVAEPDGDTPRLGSVSMHLTAVGSVMGTPDYIAPEQVRDAHSADIRADIYSLGCTLCYLLTGKPPFSADSVVNKLKAHERQQPPALQELRDDVPAELADIVTRMMARNPDDRFQTPAEVAKALDPFADSQLATMSNANHAKTKKPLAIAAGLLSLALCAVIFIVTDRGRLEIHSTVDGVQVTVTQNDGEVRVLEPSTGTTVYWLPSGEYRIAPKGNAQVTLDAKRVSVTRFGRKILTITVQPIANATERNRLQGVRSGASGRQTGILTNPPSVPLGGLPVGRNLIADPSLEDTPTGSLPKTWSAWLDDGPDFKCEVVEGGVTGNHCLQISGKGTRGVVFCTSRPMDRTKRYALKGRVKVEGDAATWAVIKINYFNKTGWLGVDDRVGVSSKKSGWQFFEKTDRADDYPEATLMVPTCHIEGNGTAWFDDLELVAYDRGELPADFDEQHGKNNR
ncbi:serine/threonine protein kinase [Fuerstiella marisgermanici]|uniref:non-specific serine/threonine protein kinase n=1 Tax=Fuerstiella marisgermanici TaxID=1891926 RepID=A0A1P8WH79_9PLAN|nr:serine/threonine-protein kinase [Fuerstiella marisgermanici]APZ93390.1 Serine/threonine-protein kinase PknB [Fuerstiella marisgermanici]